MVRVRITNLKEFEADLKKQIAEIVSFALERNIRSIARTDAFDTGTFHNSIHAVSDKIAQGIVEVEDGVEYGKFLEWGTIKMRPRAIFQRGLNMTIKQLPELLKQVK